MANGFVNRDFAVELNLLSDGDCADKLKLFPVFTVKVCCQFKIASN